MNPPDSDTNLEHRINLLEQESAALLKRLEMLEKSSIRLEDLFHPKMGFLAASVFTLAFAFFSLAMFRDQELKFYLSYIVPIAMPFVGFLFERVRFCFLNRLYLRNIPAHLLDTAVVAISLLRVIYPVPFISGHAAFLTYALLTTRSWWVRIPVILVWSEVFYLKAFVWNDSTLYGGILLGSLAGILWHISTKSHKILRRTAA